MDSSGSWPFSTESIPFSTHVTRTHWEDHVVSSLIPFSPLCLSTSARDRSSSGCVLSLGSLHQLSANCFGRESTCYWRKPCVTCMNDHKIRWWYHPSIHEDMYFYYPNAVWFISENNKRCKRFARAKSCISLPIWIFALNSSCLREEPEGKVDWPSVEQMQQSRDAVCLKLPRLAHMNPFCFVDGLNLPILNPKDALKQNAYYNG